MKTVLCVALLVPQGFYCPAVPDKHISVPVTLQAGCVLPFDSVAYSPAAHTALMTQLSDAQTELLNRQATIKRLVRTIESTPEPVSRVSWFTAGAAAGAAIIVGAFALNWAL